MTCSAQAKHWLTKEVPEKLGAEYTGRPSSRITSYLITGDASLDDGLGIAEPEFAPFLADGIKNLEEFDFSVTNVIDLFKEK